MSASSLGLFLNKRNLPFCKTMFRCFIIVVIANKSVTVCFPVACEIHNGQEIKNKYVFMTNIALNILEKIEKDF